MHTLLTAATDSSGSAAGLAAVFFLGGVTGYIIGTLPLYGIFVKAGEPGWAGFVPIYSTIVLLKITGRPVWWIVLYLIPVVNIVIAIIVLHGLSTSFGHGAGFTVGLLFLSLIFQYILWLGSSTYRKPVQVGPGGYVTA
ncbi:DUF5684 domain-containing protein [Cellulomonas hominis]